MTNLYKNLYRLCSVLRELTNSQCIELVQLLVKELKEVYIPLLDHLPRSSSTKKRRKRESSSNYKDINSDSLIVLLHLLVDLIGHLLLSFKLDELVSGRYKMSMKSVLNELVSDIYLLIMEVSQEKVSSLFLILSDVFLALDILEICWFISSSYSLSIISFNIYSWYYSKGRVDLFHWTGLVT